MTIWIDIVSQLLKLGVTLASGIRSGALTPEEGRHIVSLALGAAQGATQPKPTPPADEPQQ